MSLLSWAAAGGVCYGFACRTALSGQCLPKIRRDAIPLGHCYGKTLQSIQRPKSAGELYRQRGRRVHAEGCKRVSTFKSHVPPALQEMRQQRTIRTLPQARCCEFDPEFWIFWIFTALRHSSALLPEHSCGADPCVFVRIRTGSRIKASSSRLEVEILELDKQLILLALLFIDLVPVATIPPPTALNPCHRWLNSGQIGCIPPSKG